MPSLLDQGQLFLPAPLTRVTYWHLCRCTASHAPKSFASAGPSIWNTYPLPPAWLREQQFSMSQRTQRRFPMSWNFLLSPQHQMKLDFQISHLLVLFLLSGGFSPVSLEGSCSPWCCLGFNLRFSSHPIIFRHSHQLPWPQFLPIPESWSLAQTSPSLQTQISKCLVFILRILCDGQRHAYMYVCVCVCMCAYVDLHTMDTHIHIERDLYSIGPHTHKHMQAQSFIEM